MIYCSGCKGYYTTGLMSVKVWTLCTQHKLCPNCLVSKGIVVPLTCKNCQLQFVEEIELNRKHNMCTFCLIEKKILKV